MWMVTLLLSWGSLGHWDRGENCGKLKIVLGCAEDEVLAGPAGRSVQRPLSTLWGHQQRDGVYGFRQVPERDQQEEEE